MNKLDKQKQNKDQEVRAEKLKQEYWEKIKNEKAVEDFKRYAEEYIDNNLRASMELNSGDETKSTLVDRAKGASEMLAYVKRRTERSE